MIHPVQFFAYCFKYARYPKLARRLRRIVAIEWCTPFISNAERVVEVGASKGTSICYFAREFPKKKFVAFETDDSQYRGLEREIRKFTIRNITTLKKDLYDYHENEELFDFAYMIDVL